MILYLFSTNLIIITIIIIILLISIQSQFTYC